MRHIVLGLIGLLATINLFAAEALNNPLPNFTLENNQGASTRSTELSGQIVLLNFWASWCKPCLEEMPLLNRLHNQYGEAGFTVLGVNIENTTDSDTLGQVNAFISKKNIAFPVLYDARKELVNNIERDIMDKKMGLPTTLFIDKNGNVRYLHEGYMPGDEGKYRELIELLIRE